MLTPGDRLGPYEIVASVGAGGMGEVYRARDTRLNRTVALKILAPSLAADPASTGRFRREAEAVAALHHPNICVLHDIGRESSTDFIVMEHLDGESLAQRMERGRLNLDEALRVGIEVARALGAAHRAGVVHRDLKPGNIVLTPAGAKLVDFGLAQLKPQVGAAVVTVMTQTTPATAPGTILGTLPYMAPEQIEGHTADARTDVFALGAVLYEMVTGKRAFPADSAPSLIASILERDPQPIVAALPSAPPLLQRVVSKCLAKRPDDRWQAADDVAEALDWVRTSQTVGQQGRRTSAIAWIAAAAAGLVAIAALGLLAFQRPAPRDALRLSVVAPPGTVFNPIDIAGSPQFALSPDGTRIAFVAGAPNERQRLWVRRLDAPAAQALGGTEDAAEPFWSPDSTTVAFFARGRLKKVRVDGASGVQDLAAASIDVNGGTWNRDGVILFGAGPGDGLYRVSAEGGTAVPETTLDAGRKEVGHRWPQFLPDGRRYLLYVRSYQPGAAGVYLGELGSPHRRLLLESPTSGVYTSSGRLLFNQSGTLTAQKVDLESAQLLGHPESLPDQVSSLTGPSQLPVSASATGRVAYWIGDRVWSNLSWFDRAGRPLGPVTARGLSDSPELSADDTKLLFSHGDAGNLSRSIWVHDRATEVQTPLTLRPGLGRFAVWSPDSDTAAFNESTAQGSRISRRSIGGAGDEAIMLASDAHWAMMPTSWHGDHLVYQVTVTKSGWDLGLVRVSTGTAGPLVSALGHQVQGQLSPDGRWLAYASNESGTWEILAQPVSGGGKWQISSGGGTQPRWRADARELFYVAPDGTIVAVPLRSVGPSLAIAGPAQRLFQIHAPAMLAPYRMVYDVTGDGQRFIVSTVAPDTPPQVITIIDNLR
jgi:eukaryotic-like serine/threonine-protein kinase